MRVNMDESILTDPRFRLLAKELGLGLFDVVGRCFAVWLVCYNRRSDTLTKREVDCASEREGFADALAGCGLGTLVNARGVRIRGVDDRIEFLKRQSVKGRKGGETRQANARNSASSGSGDRQAYSHAHAHAHAQDQSHSQPQSHADTEASAAEDWKPGQPISSTRDLVAAVAGWGWSVGGLSPRHAGIAGRVIGAGPISSAEIVHARGVVAKKQAKGSKAVGLFLAVVESERERAAEEARQPSPAPADPWRKPDPGETEAQRFERLACKQRFQMTIEEQDWFDDYRARMVASGVSARAI